MCDLCATPEAGQQRALATAEMLDRLAQKYRQMAKGIIRPHSEQGKIVAILANNIVRELVAEWV